MLAGSKSLPSFVVLTVSVGEEEIMTDTKKEGKIKSGRISGERETKKRTKMTMKRVRERENNLCLQANY